MTMRGIGKKLEYIGIPYGVLCVFLTFFFQPVFFITKQFNIYLFSVGLVLLIIGLIGHVIAAVAMVKGFKEKKLLTSGIFALSRHPMYTTLILFIIPGTGLLINSWLFLTGVVLLLILFFLFIKEEEQYLREKFAEEFVEYKKKTGILLPKIF
ncbi:MAG: isoprenylcysteine carboxylmethyltransferase family protein [Spirochaetes bacterium]|nr:isoprenylcysteine carboxylmethyltransferase family protein [Spirochaetota bacterium]